MQKLTVIIPCKDERSNITACIESAREFADEIIVADSGSTDGTLDIVRATPGCRLVQREFVNYADFKNWAIPQAAHEWVLIVDADERLTPALAAEIRAELAGEPRVDAYELRRDNYFLGQPIKHCGWDRTFIRRLFRKAVCRYLPCRVHEYLEVDTGRVGRLASHLQHFTCVNLDSFVRRQVTYALLAGEDRYDKGRRVGYWQVLLHAPLRFWQLYLLRGGILDGFAGLVLCSIMAYYTFLKDAKLWSLHRAAASATGPGASSRSGRTTTGEADVTPVTNPSGVTRRTDLASTPKRNHEHQAKPSFCSER